LFLLKISGIILKAGLSILKTLSELVSNLLFNLRSLNFWRITHYQKNSRLEVIERKKLELSSGQVTLQVYLNAPKIIKPIVNSSSSGSEKFAVALCRHT